MLFSNVEFPIFTIPAKVGEIKESGNIIYFRDKIIDNRNLSGKDLASRRLKIPRGDRYPLRQALLNIRAVVKSGTKYFIDSKGGLFRYQKTKFYNVIYRKVISILNTNELIIFVEGIDTYITLSPLQYNYITVNHYLGLIELNPGFLIYEVSETRKKDTRKKL